MADCLACSKTTKSHVLIIAYDADADELYPAEADDRADAVATGFVCHTCYDKADGDASKLVDEYESWLRDLASNYGYTLREVVAGDVDPDDLGDPDQSVDDVDDLPEYVVEALPDHVVETHGPAYLMYEYEERHLSVEFEEGDCDACGETVRLSIATDHYRDVRRETCPDCGETVETETDSETELQEAKTDGD